ncbi:MAG: post-COAP-1 domain-containing protein [Planctomycetota bacterium]|jgi:hypothetical protein
MRINKISLIAILVVAVTATAVHAQVPKPTMNLVGTYIYSPWYFNGSLILSNVSVGQVQYLDGSTSSTDPIVGANFVVSRLQYLGIDENGEALFGDGTILVYKDSVTYMTADLVNVRLTEFGFGSFGNLNVGFESINVTNLSFSEGTGSQFVEEFAALIASPEVPDSAALQLEMQLMLVIGGPWPTTFEENFQVGSIGSVLGVFDGAPDPCVLNTAPAITFMDGNPLVVPANSATDLTVNFDDPDELDTHTVIWEFGDGSDPEVIDYATSPATISHTYTEPGIYTVNFLIVDGCGQAVDQNLYVVAYDPSAGFTTGGGWFIPDSESYVDGVPVTDINAKANFGFVCKYKQGASTPDGNLQFVYKKGDLKVHSTDMQWLVVVSHSDIRFKGQCIVNGQGPYTFKVTCGDNGEPGVGVDTFKIEIWLGADFDTENSTEGPKHKAQGVLGGGNIQLHQ